MATFLYPTALQIERINQVLVPQLMANRAIFQIFPTEDSNDFYLAWEQEDNYVGLQAVRGLDGQPTHVNRVGVKQYVMPPGVYGEFTTLGERELTTRRPIGGFGDTIDVRDLVASADNQLLQRQLDRMEYIGWTLLSTGTFAVAQADGTVLHTDTYTPQTYSAPVAWGTLATAAPLGDLRLVKLKQRGYGVRFDDSATLYANAKTVNNFVSNLNAADLYGRRTQGLGTFNNIGDINALLTQDKLPNIVEYDNGYLDDSGTFQSFIPDNKAILVGKRIDGSPVGTYRYVRNINNPNEAPGPYMQVIEESRPPRHIEVHRGHNGGIALKFPSALVILSV